MKSNLANPSTQRFGTSSGRASLIHVTDGETERPVAICYGADDLDGDGTMATRIAALLNFAEGVPTEELTGSLLELAAATALAAEELKKLRAMTPKARLQLVDLMNLGSVS